MLNDQDNNALSDIFTIEGETLKKYKKTLRAKTVVVPKGINVIADKAFFNSKYIQKIILPNGLQQIGLSVFGNCNSLSCVEIPNSVRVIKGYAFSHCDSLKNIKFNGTIEQWNSIKKWYRWDYYAENYIIVCLDGEIKRIN